MTIRWNHKPLSNSQPIPWTERRYGMCAFPLDADDGKILSCALPVLGERSYCRAHCKVVYTVGVTKRVERPYAAKTDAR